MRIVLSFEVFPTTFTDTSLFSRKKPIGFPLWYRVPNSVAHFAAPLTRTSLVTIQRFYVRVVRPDIVVPKYVFAKNAHEPFTVHLPMR